MQPPPASLTGESHGQRSLVNYRPLGCSELDMTEVTEHPIQTLLAIPYVCKLIGSVMSTLCNPMDCNSPGSSVHMIFLARILEWVAISSFRGSV